MPRLFLFTLLFFPVTFLPAQTWSPIATYPGQRTECASGFSVSGYGYIVCGNTGSLTNDLWQYDPVNDAWTQKANFPGVGRKYASAFTLADTAYVCAGAGNSGQQNDLWAYYPSTNSWVSKANFLGTARYGTVTFAVGGYGYIGCGYDGTTTINDFWKYDPTTDSWSQVASLSSLRWQGVSFATASYGYVCSGFTSVPSNTFYNDLRQYDPVSNNWAQKTSLPTTGRWLGVAFAIGNEGFVGLGRDGANNVQNDFWQYHENSDSWSQIASYPGGPRILSSAFAIGECGYVGLGDSTKHGFDTNNTLFWKYCLPDPKGIEENNLESMIRIFTSGNMLQTETDGLLIRDVMLYNVSGQVLKHQSAQESRVTMDISDLADGAYIVSVQTDNGTCNRKIMLIR
jgi:N-acetylneuraminic acid mutarotase